MTPAPILRCKCGHVGIVFGFVWINGKQLCVTCAGRKEIKPSAKQIALHNRGKSKYERSV